MKENGGILIELCIIIYYKLYNNTHKYKYSIINTYIQSARDVQLQ